MEQSGIRRRLADAPYIPVAEGKAALIMTLGDWVLSTACRQIDAWRQLGLNEIRVAINVRFINLRDAGFIERLCDTVNATTPQAQNQLAIELTESELMDNIEMTIAQLEILKNQKLHHLHRRLRHRLLILSYLQKTAGACAQNRPEFCRHAGEIRKQHCHCAHHRRAGTKPQAQDHR